MAAPAAVLSILIRANSTQAVGAIGATDAKLKQTAATAEKTNATLKKWGKGAALAVAGAGAASAKMAVDFDKGMRNVNSIAQLPEKQFDKLSKSVLRLAGPTAQAPKALAEGLYDLVSSGFDSAESLQILEQSARGATAGLTTAEISTKAVAAVLNAYRMPAKNAADVTDVLFRTVDRGVISFADLASNIGDVLPFAASLGVDLRQVGASIATMTKAGISPSETMTRIKSVMVSMLKPSEALARVLKAQGFASGEALIKAKGFQGALELLARSTGGSKAKLAELFPNVRALGGALALTGANARGAGKDLKGMGDAAGSTNRALSEQAKSTAFQWQQLKAEISVTMIEIGSVVLPVMNAIIKALRLAQGVIRGTFRSLGKFMVEVWTAPKRAFGNLLAAILRGMARLFDAAANLPVVGKEFKGVGDKVRRTAGEVDKLGEEIDGVGKKRVTARVMLDIVARDLATGDVQQLYKGSKPGKGGGKDYGTGVRGAVADSAKAWAQRNKKAVQDSIGLGAGVGALGGGSKSRVDAFNSIAGRFGNSITSGFRPGDPGWHGKNRARDYSGGNMLGFARHMASKYGKNLLELIHTPLGFGIKNGRKVAPYAQADHYDHVHVAMRKGGLVPGSGSGDRVPALLEAGEGIINKKATAAMGGPRAINAINSTIPRFASGGTVARAARGAGFKGGNLLRAVAEAKGESGWNERAVGDGGKSKGLMQIHTGWNPWAAGMNLFNPATNMRAAMRIFRSQGWGAWHANHVPHIGAARAAVAAAGKGGGPGPGKKVSPKQRKKMSKQLKKKLRRIKGVGLSKKTEANLKKLTENAAIYGEYADRAGTLTGDGPAGVANGLGEASWLQKQLDTLFTLRNALIRAEKAVVAKRQGASKELDKAYEWLRAHPLSGEKKGKDPVAGWKGVSPATGSMNAWNKQPIKKRKERMGKFIAKGGRLPSGRRFLADGRVATDRSGAGRRRQAENLKKKVIPALKKSRSGLNTRRGELLTDLERVQGLGAPSAVLKSLPALGALGGEIFSAQTRLRDLGAKATSTDTTAPVADTARADLLAGLLRESNLRTAVSQSQYDVFRNMPPFGGQFAQGGVVPGAVGSPRMVLAHGGETVTPAGAGNVQVVVNGDIINTPRGKKPIEVRDIRGYSRTLPGRGGGG